MEPLALPLSTCLTAYTHLQQLSLCELSIDPAVAAAMAAAVAANACITGLSLKRVSMCDRAWEALSEGLSRGNKLQKIK